ncbi:hypothetical protein EBU24_03685 [bacterium]|nr:hypothetical protein [bacterium]
MKNLLLLLCITSTFLLNSSESDDTDDALLSPANILTFNNNQPIALTLITKKPTITQKILKKTHALELIPDETLKTLHKTCSNTLFPYCLCAAVSALSCWWLSLGGEVTMHCKDLTYITSANSTGMACCIECLNAEISNRNI